MKKVILMYCLCGGMVDAVDSKSAILMDVRVQISPEVNQLQAKFSLNIVLLKLIIPDILNIVFLIIEVKLHFL